MVEGLSLGESIQGEVGKPVTFSVDAANAGEGTLELVVSTAQSTVKAEVILIVHLQIILLTIDNNDKYPLSGCGMCKRSLRCNICTSNL